MNHKNTISSIPSSSSIPSQSDPSDKSDQSVSSVNTIESLVPPLDLCKQIPEGAFTNSVFVWSYSCDKRKTEPFLDERDCIEFCRRDMVNAPPVYPAPTLQEILNELPKYNENEVTLACVPSFLPGDKGRIFGEAWSVGYTAKSSVTDATPATAALKLWFELNPPDQKSGEIK